MKRQIPYVTGECVISTILGGIKYWLNKDKNWTGDKAKALVFRDNTQAYYTLLTLTRGTIEAKGN
jgi:hypothetical protein